MNLEKTEPMQRKKKTPHILARLLCLQGEGEDLTSKIFPNFWETYHVPLLKFEEAAKVHR